MANIRYHVFLDTEVFIENHFNYNSSDFQILTNLHNDGDVKIYITDIVYNELLCNIKKEIFSTIAEINNKLIKLSQGITDKNILSLIGKDKLSKLYENAVNRLDKFIDNLKVIKIKVEDDLLKGVLDDYFNDMPPFITKHHPDKKAKEFPDAFSAAAIVHWCRKHSISMHVISNNFKDWKDICERNNCLIYKEKLTGLFELFPDHTIVAILIDSLDKQAGRINEYVSSKFIEFPFDIVGGPDNDVELMDTFCYSAEMDKIRVIEAKDGAAKVEVRVFACYIANIIINYKLNKNETKEYDGNDFVYLNISMSYDKSDPTINNITNIEINHNEVYLIDLDLLEL